MNHNVFKKIRLDYVTNSSSSSFIIGSINEDLNIDDVFVLIRDLYCELNKKIDSIKIFIQKHPNLHLSYSDKRGLYFNEKINFEKEMGIRKMIEDTFSIDLYDVRPLKNTDWLNLHTYQEYQNYWIERIKDSEFDYNVHAPFTIIDFLNPKTTFLHFHYDHKIVVETEDVSNHSDIYLWYLDEDEILYSVNKEKACLSLGRYCISSECGYIPNFVVYQLYELCKYACNHMG